MQVTMAGMLKKLGRQFQAQYFDVDPEMLLKLYQDYLREMEDDWNYILPTELNSIIKKGDTSNLFLLDVRRSKDFDKGHIPGTVNIYWLDVLNPENMKKLPVDKEIILICYLGHTSSQLLVMLSTLGYRCKSLKFGMGKSPVPGVEIKSWLDYGFPIV